MSGIIIFNTKTRTKFTAFLICIVMLCNFGIFSLNASAADIYNNMEVKTPLFADVDESASYYGDLKFLVDSNVISSSPNGFFVPQKIISRGEFITLLVVALKSSAATVKKTNSFTDISGHWSARYIDIAVANGIVNQDIYGTKFYPDAPVTRYEAAVFIVNSLNIYTYSTLSLFSDVNNEYINIASGEYLLSGYNETGKMMFKPQKVLTRGDICGVIANVIQYRNSIESYKNAKILEYVKNNPITTERQMYDLLKACTTNFMSKVDARVHLSDAQVESAFNTYIALNPEKPTISSINYLSDGVEWNRSLFKFNYDISKSEEEKKMKEVNKIAEKFTQSYIKPGMSDIEKIVEIHNYIVQNCEYDERYINVYSVDDVIMDETTLDLFTAYGALVKKKAVCQGYSAAFNILAKKVGISSVAISGTPPKSSINHMWNMVCINGILYFIDTTWDSTIPSAEQGQINIAYLLKTEKEFAAFGYKWNPTYAKKEYLNK